MTNKIPNIRFKGFTDDWEQRKLGEVADKTYGGGTPKTSIEEYWQGNIPWIQSQDLSENKVFGVEPRKYINQKAIENSATKIIPKNSIAIITRVGVGKLALMPISYCTSQDFLSLSSLKINELYATYVIYKMLQIEKEKVQGTSIKGITSAELLSKKIDVPIKYAEQQKVGEYFSNLDCLITLHQRKCEQTKELKKFMLQKMFPKKGEKNPEIRFPGFTDDWEQRKFPEFVEFYNGLTYSPDDVRASGTLVLRSSNVKNGEIVDADNVYVEPDKATSENVKEGDIIVVVRNGSRALIGKHAEIKESMSNTVIGAFMSGIRSEHSSFVNALLDTNQFEKEIEKNMGATINQITGYMFSKMEFTIPSPTEQDKIGNYFKYLDHLITLHQRKCEQLKELKKFMLQNMFPKKG